MSYRSVINRNALTKTDDACEALNSVQGYLGNQPDKGKYLLALVLVRLATPI